MFHAVSVPANESPAEAQLRWHRLRSFLEHHRDRFGLDDWDNDALNFAASAIVCLPQLLVLAEQLSHAMADAAVSTTQN